MNCTVERIETNVVKLEITVPAEKFRDAIKKSYSKNVNRFNVPGFRKGKAPMAIIEKMYGESVFYEDAINIVCEETYPQAIKENNISPVDYPEIDIVEIGKEVDFKYTAKVVVKPEVKLGDYKNIEAKEIEYPVTEEDVEVQLNAMREKSARIINKEDGEVAEGDIAVIDFEGFIDGVAFEGGKGENYDLKIGSNTFIPGFEAQIIGAKIGETVDVDVTFPEDYHAEELKGKPALFKVTVKGIKVKELPALDDEFAKDASEFDTLEELKSDIRKKQEESNKARAKRDFEDEVVKKAVESSEVEIPEVMIEKEIEFMVRDLDYRLRYQGLTVEKYVELMGITMDTIKNDFKEVAANKVKTNLVLEAIAKAENITVSEEDVEKRAEEIANIYGSKDVEKVKETILRTERPIIEEELVNNKVIEFLVNNSKIVA
ncbi:trigger factor [Fervidicella metallireducens AeB]|uniref:Trigger factor n=1 Tax=Fervidicella metallireducens AeB TaxID=1403537 RepID=A0A017RW74_9CLOT|nr:trigger factor [Fervidicella metallireducens]EYE89008.1 trigger factor [Fervidicella metallireducens AeB]